jgi:hypothetical protein
VTAELISSPATRRRTSWAGRASQHRRQQVGSRDARTDAQVEALWLSLVEVLRAMDDPSSAVLCTVEGTPVAAYGLPKPEVPRVSRQAGTAFATRTRPDGSVSEVETVELTAGRRHTVIASVPGADADHLLSVTAEGVSPPLLEAWTRRAAEDLRQALSVAAAIE